MDNNEFLAKIDDRFVKVSDLKKEIDEITKDWDSSAIKELRRRCEL